MPMNETGVCGVCGKPGSVHVAEVRDGVSTTRSFCDDHVPSEIRDQLPADRNRTPTEEIALLRNVLATLDEKVEDPEARAQTRVSIEKLIDDIGAGRRRLGESGELDL